VIRKGFPYKICSLSKNPINDINGYLNGNPILIIILGVYLEETCRENMEKFGNKTTLVI
jgi:hypothetical protein